MIGTPSRSEVATSLHGAGRARAIRVLYAERCSLAEICAALNVDLSEVARTLRRPVRAPVRDAASARRGHHARQRRVCGRFAGLPR
jgi:IS30 family transposase